MRGDIVYATGLVPILRLLIQTAVNMLRGTDERKR